MIPAEYYSLVYIIIIILFAIPVLIKYSDGYTIYDDNRNKEPIIGSLLFTIFIILFIGFRPNSPVFADGPGYWAAIEDHRWEYGTLEDVNYQFATKWLMATMSSLYFPPRLGFIVLAIIYYGGGFIAMRKMFPNDTMLAMILFCANFGSMSCAVNGIKNGMALSMFLCAIAFRKSWLKCLFFLIISFGFHHSMEINICAFILCLFYKKTNNYYALWIVCLIIAALHITYFQTILADYTDEHGASYLLTDEYSLVFGFRWDFILYSMAPLALGWWVKSKIDIQGLNYQFVLDVYLVMNSIWLLCMYAAFTNRIAELSWALFPVLILEPLLKNKIKYNQHKVLIWFVIGQMTFTLLMTILPMI